MAECHLRVSAMKRVNQALLSLFVFAPLAVAAFQPATGQSLTIKDLARKCHLNFERIFIMQSKLISAAVLAVAALTSVAASAEIYNSYLFDQMKAPASRTRAEVKAEVLQARQGATPVAPGSANNGATEPQKASAPTAERVKTSQP